MICTQLLTLSLLVYITNSATRHFTGEYKISPVAIIGKDPVRIAFPIDKCVNYEATAVPPAILFGKYECNAQNDQVTFTRYGEDSTCAAESLIPSGDSENPCDSALCGPFTMTNKSPGDYQSFSCTGDDNYAEVHSCTATLDSSATYAIGDDGTFKCCAEQNAEDANGGCLSQLQSTDACIEVYDGSGYTMTTCDNATVTTELFNDNTCTGASTLVSEQSPDYCSYYDQIAIGGMVIYRRLLKCFEAGYDIAPADVYCPYETDPPTKAPTNNPTATPTTSESPEDSTDKGNMYVIVYGIVMVWIVGMCMR